MPNETSLSYPGWRVALAAFVGVMVSFAAMVPFTFSLFLTPLQDAFGWKREAISRAFAITALTVAACSPTIGTLLDRLAPRRIILPCILVFAAGMASLSLLGPHIAQFYATYLLLGIVGNGTAQLAYSRAVLTWFEQRRGLALAVVLTGSGTGSILLPIIAQHVITTHGFRASYLTLGAIALLGFPLTALLVRNRASASTPHHTASPIRIGSVLGTKIFWLIAIPVMLSALSLNGAIAHLAALLTGRAVTPASAAIALSMLGVSGILGRLITGHLLDRLFAPYVSLAVLLVAAAGILTLAFANTAATGILGAFLIGFGSGSEADVVPFLIAKYFGRTRFSTLYGLTWTAYAVGGAIGPVFLGHAFDQSKTYLPSAVVALAVPLILAAILQLFLPRYPEALTTANAPVTLEPAHT
ncbi:Predicted arabinose efflux permease, MFS family [Granulicella pectinivorans]|uniref:Predicted arabinose efflux permease, MFS family n=1 Tax=Granulicella pectinivorans TaxID=474950 RepID=A0A1I6LVT5_9BACT|nr:MFS transporter [Granulicella pectinivorans]SFS07500.1 Predicted arabinose efflux permease, MFS family [Granulicella pectinivorans]